MKVLPLKKVCEVGMRGKLIVIEGVDGSGKQTQSEKLYRTLESKGLKVKKIEFPDYDSESSALVKMYLRGDFGTNPEDVSAYVASSFFAADRYASYNTKWKEFYLSGGIIIADRYTTANMVHQASKIGTRSSGTSSWSGSMIWNSISTKYPSRTWSSFLMCPRSFPWTSPRKEGTRSQGKPRKIFMKGILIIWWHLIRMRIMWLTSMGGRKLTV